MKKLALLTLLALSGHSANASSENSDIPQLWQLTAYKSAKQMRVVADASSPVLMNRDVTDSLSANRAYQLPISADKSINVTLSGGEQRGDTRVWRIKNNADSSLPDGKLFQRNGSFSAWIPTEFGTFRLIDDVLLKEFRMGGEVADYKPVSFTQPAIDFGHETETEELFHGYNHSQQPMVKSKQPVLLTDDEEEQDTFEQEDAEPFVVSPSVLFVVTEAFADNFDDFEAVIEDAVEINNAIYAESGVNITLDIADVIVADLESFSNDQILDNLARSGSDDSTYGEISLDILEPVWEAKLDSEADIITVITHSRPDGLCGEAWLNGNEALYFSSRFSVNVVSATTEFDSGNVATCATDTLGHEIGHNMGLGHSLQQGEEGSVFHFGRGHGVDDRFTTVMAYPQEFGDAVALPLYSSPDLECEDGLACGINAEQEDGADAVLAMNEVRQAVTTIQSDARSMHIDDALDQIDSVLWECIEDENGIMYSNEDMEILNCPNADIASFDGFEAFPKMRFLSVNSSEDPSLEPFRQLAHFDTLDFRLTPIEDLRPIAHLKDRLGIIRFLATELSCQDVNVAQSWGIETFIPLGNCFELDSDEEDFDDDGINNLEDVDDDNDGIDDLTDFLPYDDENKGDIDADGVEDELDAFPYDPEEDLDTDLDFIGNNEDDDDDNDGFPDDEDCAPLDPYLNEDCDGDLEPDDSEPGDSDPGDEEPTGQEPGGEEPDCDVDDCDNQETEYVPYDFDGDGKADVGVRRASNAFQYILNSSDEEIQRIELGRNLTDISVTGDFDGDGIADIGVRRPENQFWYIRLSSEEELLRMNYGRQREDIPVPADYDGDGITDFAVRRPSTQEWFIRSSDTEETIRYQFGLQEDDIPVVGDYDGDGKADIAVRRPSNQFWYVLKSSDEQIIRMNFGRQEEDIPVPADYDGDNITDFAVRRPSNHTWYILQSTDEEIVSVRFGRDSGDIPIVADYDGDGKADIAVRRPSNFYQYILRSSDNEIERIKFGKNPSDMPLAAPVSYRREAVIDAAAFIDEPLSAPEFGEKTVLSAEEAIKQQVYNP